MSLANLVRRSAESDFKPGSVTKHAQTDPDTGETVHYPAVNVTIPGAIATQNRGVYDVTTPVVLGSINEQSVPVPLETHAYNGVPLSDAELTLDLKNFAIQVLGPQTDAITRDVDQRVARAMQSTPESTAVVYDAANPARAFTAARRILRDNGVGGDAVLRAAVGSDVYADLLDGPSGTFAEDGKVRGFEVTESTRLKSTEAVFFIPQAFCLALRAPAVPEGVGFGASVVNEKLRIAMRYIRDYDASRMLDRSVVSVFAGARPMPLAVNRENGTVDLVEHGGAVRIDTAA
ncbi:hypothetical protein ACWFQT_20340 [Cellulosimicrobium cellulans]